MSDRIRNDSSEELPAYLAVPLQGKNLLEASAGTGNFFSGFAVFKSIIRCGNT